MTAPGGEKRFVMADGGPRCGRHPRYGFVGYVWTAFTAALVVPLLTSAAAFARCGDVPGDLDAVVATRAQVDAQCPCYGAESHRAYRLCASQVVTDALAAKTLPTQCAHMVKSCAARSVCGRPGSVPCCRTNRFGKTR